MRHSERATRHTMDAAAFHAARRYLDLPCGRIAYVEQGAGPAALFVHGVPLNGFHWRHVMAGLSDLRRCIAVDLMGLGYTEAAPGQDLSFPAQARMLERFIDALGLQQVDLIGNDSGGGIAQIFAARHPQRLRTLTLTNCDVHDGWPPKSILPIIEAARQGVLADAYRKLLDAPDAARARFSIVYAEPAALSDEALRIYLEPITSTPQRQSDFHRYWIAMDPAQTIEIEPLLRELRVPTLIVWGLEDSFFGIESAQWLRRTIPGSVDLVEVPGAKLFFAEDRPHALLDPLREFLVR